MSLADLVLCTWLGARLKQFKLDTVTATVITAVTVSLTPEREVSVEGNVCTRLPCGCDYGACLDC